MRSKVVRIDPSLDRLIRETQRELSRVLNRKVTLSETQRIMAASNNRGINILNVSGKKKRKGFDIDMMVKF